MPRPSFENRVIGAIVSAAMFAGTGCSSAGNAATEIVRQDRGEVRVAALLEASGLAASRVNPGVLWTHNDKGGTPRLFALSETAADLGSVGVSGARHVDWEDIAIGPGPLPGESYIYVGDIGDKKKQRPFVTVYRFLEPRLDRSASRFEDTVENVQAIRLRYPDGPVNAETLMIDPLTGDLYVATKDGRTVTIFRAAAPHTTDEPILLEPIAGYEFDEVPERGRKSQGAVGGDISPSGLAVLIKSYDTIWLWRRDSADDALFGADAVRAPYLPEPHGEAVAWAADGSGYFTISEVREDVNVHLYFYPVAPAARGGR